jgi:multidrug resistance efflux pump
MVAGGAYYAGKKVQKGRAQDAEQDARLDEVESTQAQAPQAAPAPSGGITDDVLKQLERLGQLKEQGVLTQEEFDAQKRRLLPTS